MEKQMSNLLILSKKITMLILVIVILSSGYTKIAEAKFNEQELATAYKSDSEFTKISNLYRTDKDQCRQILSDERSRFRTLPADSVAAKIYMDDLMRLEGLLFSRIEEQKDIAADDMPFCLKILNDERSFTGDRSIAGILIYLSTNDLAYLKKAFVIAPRRMHIFTKVHNDQYEILLLDFLGEASREEILFGEKFAKRPYSSIFNWSYDLIVKSLYFQHVNMETRIRLFNKFGYFQPGTGMTQPLHATDIASVLKDYPGEINQFFTALLLQDREDDVNAVVAKYPALRSEAVRSAVDVKSNLVQKIKKLDEQIIH